MSDTNSDCGMNKDQYGKMVHANSLAVGSVRPKPENANGKALREFLCVAGNGGRTTEVDVATEPDHSGNAEWFIAGGA